MKLIEKERVSKLISSTIKPKIEGLLSASRTKLSILEMKQGNFYFRVNCDEEKSKVELDLNLTKINVGDIDWIFDYTILKDYRELLKVVKRINQDIEEMKELMSKIEDAFSNQFNLFKSKRNELVKSKYVESVEDESNLNVYIRNALIGCILLRIVDEDYDKIKSFYECKYQEYFKVNLEILYSKLDEITKELKLDYDVVQRFKEIKEELVYLNRKLKQKIEELLRYWRKKYDIIKYRNKTELDKIKM